VVQSLLDDLFDPAKFQFDSDDSLMKRHPPVNFSESIIVTVNKTASSQFFQGIFDLANAYDPAQGVVYFNYSNPVISLNIGKRRKQSDVKF
jgi:hypothetical protein